MKNWQSTKMFRIKLSNRDEIVLHEDKLLALLASKEQIVKVNISANEWEVINKAHIVNAKIDVEESKRLRESFTITRAPEAPTVFSMEKMIETKKKLIESGIIKE